MAKTRTAEGGGIVTERQLVYVVDDEPSVRRALGRQLRSLGYRSREFASGRELFASGRWAKAACLVVDINMPDMNGYEVARRLAEAAPASPVILITGFTDELERWRLQKTSAINLLLKPFVEQELIEVLRQALE